MHNDSAKMVAQPQKRLCLEKFTCARLWQLLGLRLPSPFPFNGVPPDRSIAFQDRIQELPCDMSGLFDCLPGHVEFTSNLPIGTGYTFRWVWHLWWHRMGGSRFEGRVDGLLQLRTVEFRKRSGEKNIGQVPCAARLSTRIRSRVGVQFLRDLRVQWITTHFRRSDFGKRQKIRHSQFDRSLKDRITISNIQLERFKAAAIKQTANWETESAPWGTGCRFCRFAHLKLKPITQVKRDCCSKMRD